MNQLSRRCKYALRALYLLNREYSVGLLSVMRKVRKAVAGVLDHTTLADACTKSDAEHALTYGI